VVTNIVRNGEGWLVRGVTADNGVVKSVIVNRQAARATRDNFAEWEIVLKGNGTALEVKAHAEDAAGNVEKRAHVVN
jgi:hypothetical protein